MRKSIAVCWVALLWINPAPAGESPGKVIRETWDAAYLGGGKAGYVQTTTRELAKGGATFFQTTVQYRLQAKRFNETIQLGMDIGSTETAAGKVTAILLRHFLGKDKKLDLRGEVYGKQLKLTLEGGKQLKPAPWDDRVVGLGKQQTLFHDKNVKLGDAFDYLSFEPSINLVVTTRVQVKEFETVELFHNKTQQKLLRVETKIDPIEGVQLPAVVYWLDEQLEPVRSQTVLPVGPITLYRTTKAEAANGGTAALADIGLSQVIKLNRKIVNPFAAKKAVYQVKIQGLENPAHALAQDLRQASMNVKKDSFELHISAGPSGVAEKAGDEFIQSSYFINCEDAQVKKLAKLAVGPEKDAWKKALRIEKWVNQHMKATNDEGMTPADQVARTLQGDCSEYAMLMAAMCRAESVPCKTAMGLVYTDLKGKGPVFSFHMWTEVWVKGQWLPLDATLGRGFVGATHLKITDHSWHDTQTLTPVLPIYNLLGKLSIEVVKVEY